MISKEKVFFLNQLVDSMDKAAAKLYSASVSEKQKKEIIDFIFSIQDEIKQLLLVIK